MLAQTIGEIIESKGSVADPQVVANESNRETDRYSNGSA